MFSQHRQKNFAFRSQSANDDHPDYFAAVKIFAARGNRFGCGTHVLFKNIFCCFVSGTVGRKYERCIGRDTLFANRIKISQIFRNSICIEVFKQKISDYSVFTASVFGAAGCENGQIADVIGASAVVKQVTEPADLFPSPAAIMFSASLPFSA